MQPEHYESPIDQALNESRRLIGNGRYAAARKCLLSQFANPSDIPGDACIHLAAIEKALSNYAAAKKWLEFARQDPTVRAAAYAEEAEIAWIGHCYEEGLELSLQALSEDPMHRRAMNIRDRCLAELAPAKPIEKSGLVLSHVAFHASRGGNFGDIALPLAVRAVFSSVANISDWTPFHVHQLFARRQVKAANTSHGIVVGGGGLFLPDTAPNGNSGWQWNISEKSLASLQRPLAVYAVGFNFFKGQTASPLFKRSLIALVEKASVIGLRNRGSIEKVCELLPNELHGKVSYVPCPTVVLNRLCGPQTEFLDGPILINIAFDRSRRRFGSGYPAFLAQMAIYIGYLQKNSIPVRFVSHLPSDERFVKDLEETHGLHLSIDPLYSMDVIEAYEVYRRASLVVGMRGHASMIPFGLGIPILSLISHPKMRYFLEDIDRVEWGFDIDQADLADRLKERTLDILGAQTTYRKDIAGLQLKLLAPVQHEARRFIDTIT